MLVNTGLNGSALIVPFLLICVAVLFLPATMNQTDKEDCQTPSLSLRISFITVIYLQKLATFWIGIGFGRLIIKGYLNV